MVLVSEIGVGRRRRREPERGVLHQTLLAHIKTFLKRTRAPDSVHGLPCFVERELRRHLECEFLAQGLARVHCSRCLHVCVAVPGIVRRTLLDWLEQGALAAEGDGPERSRSDDSVPAERPSTGKPAERTPVDVAKMGEAVVADVAKNPGQSVEQIKKALGVEKTDLQFPIISLIDAKKLKTTGQKRGSDEGCPGEEGVGGREQRRRG